MAQSSNADSWMPWIRKGPPGSVKGHKQLICLEVFVIVGLGGHLPMKIYALPLLDPNAS